jgi:pyruvate kinase
MITAPVPTRAEVSDVATAIYEGADAVMLSAESATGDYPVKAVQTMHDVAREVESDPSYQQLMTATRQQGGTSDADSITAAAREIALRTDVKAIASYTQSGTTALRAARERPPVPILALTPNQTTARQLSLVWGLRCEVVSAADRFRTAVRQALQCALEAGLVSSGERIITSRKIDVQVSGKSGCT